MAVIDEGGAGSDTPRQNPPPAGAPAAQPEAAWPQDALDALPLNRRHALVFGLCAAGLLFESLNLQLMSYAAPLIARAWSLGPARVGLAISAAIGGMLVGTYLFGALADRMGRRPVFQVTVAIFAGFTALSGFSTSLWQLVIARFVAGLGIGGSIPVETAILSEFTPSRWRSRAIAVWAMALPVGALIAPLCVAVLPETLGWRGLLFVGGAPAVLVIILRRAIPETPPHLAARGRLAEAASALAWLQGAPAAPPPAQRTPDRAEPAAPEARLFAADLRNATITSWALYFATFFAYYGFMLWLPTLLVAGGAAKPEVLRFMLGVAFAGLCGRATLLAVAERLPKRWTLAACGLAGAGALTLFASGGATVAGWGCAGLAAFFLEGTFSLLIPLVAALYPPEVRATGIGWAGGMGRVGTALAPLTMGLVASYGGAPVLLLAAAAGGAGILGAALMRSAR